MSTADDYEAVLAEMDEWGTTVGLPRVGRWVERLRAAGIPCPEATDAETLRRAVGIVESVVHTDEHPEVPITPAEAFALDSTTRSLKWIARCMERAS